MNYVQLQQAIQDYSENTEQLFVYNIPRFVQEAEKRIYNSVQLPSLRKNVTGTLTSGNKYLSLPDDWLSTYSLAVIDTDGSYNYLLNKDVNFLREAYPNPTTAVGLPKYYSIFGSTLANLNELSAMMAPTPNSNYGVELHYYHYPVSIVQGVITSFGTLAAGSGYISGVYTEVPLTGGSGTNVTATILVVGGVVTSITLNNGGSFYTSGDALTASNSYLGGAGSGFSITVSLIDNALGTSWLGDNYDPVLLYGAMREAMLFMKGEADLVGYYENKYQEALAQLKRLGDGLERNDAYRKGQTSLEYKGL
jgi:hypothetical protein